MSYLTLDDNFTEHPKLLLVGDRAGWAHLRAMLYCARHLTDGLIPAPAAEEIARTSKVPSLIRKLVDAGLWEQAQGGFRVHDYLKHNLSRAQVLARRAATAERVQRYRQKEPDAPGNGVTNGVSNGVGNTAPLPSPPIGLREEAPVTRSSLTRESDSVGSLTESEADRRGGNAKGGEPGFGAGTPPAERGAKEPALPSKRQGLSPSHDGSPHRSTDGAAIPFESKPTKTKAKIPVPDLRLKKIPAAMGAKERAERKARLKAQLRASEAKP